MILVRAIDIGTTPEFSVAGPCAVERISAGQVRISYFAIYSTENGEPEPRVVARMVWDWETFMRAFDLYAGMRQQMQAAPILSMTGLPLLRAH